ncbi:hypothetical protein [Martelella alba]|uniref:hypothetical protein n=1 Tax=Martelella alba TaxID=2590451 RepID=UPI0015E87123|nr:hypothetical protein [Martelella alba]
MITMNENSYSDMRDEAAHAASSISGAIETVEALRRECDGYVAERLGRIASGLKVSRNHVCNITEIMDENGSGHGKE